MQLGGILGRTLFQFPFSRSVKVDPEGINKILHQVLSSFFTLNNSNCFILSSMHARRKKELLLLYLSIYYHLIYSGNLRYSFFYLNMKLTQYMDEKCD